ncbi:MAG: 30S ribosomal protein S6 [Candidatus Thermofonsia Clade 1 bacterium]|jgi:small subunit ribosomal protein S6|uniref:Small ribosomal subunit protein bS6 n=1 Tax=Candidatus Thermofonsia Clade 1 bacterium TaxID=2364210 RepID=A0A2M8PGY0_9CHLR|nr:MAG: 30S ribosomal protein S6 [Candidatus Thermofonsia Clade 1 bacterium]RMF54151.1 MAG: 30S ribosomal protein S6 [Chloroflexota bacterium]
MRHYELTYIIASDVDEEAFNKALAQVQQWVEELGGRITETHRWGRRKLAYQIREYTEGHYVTQQLELPPQATKALERNLRLYVPIIRYLLVRADE